MSIMPPLSEDAIANPRKYINTMRDAVFSLMDGAEVVRMKSGPDYTTLTMQHVNAIKLEIRRVESLFATGRIGPKQNLDDQMPWLRR
jgi:hypothetical protein